MAIMEKFEQRLDQLSKMLVDGGASSDCVVAETSTKDSSSPAPPRQMPRVWACRQTIG